MLRVFRGFGLTRDPPGGKKGKAATATFAVTVGGTVGGNGSPDGAGKRTLNPTGILYYTIIREANLEATLEKTCMHHYLNLRPVCLPCNSRLGNLNTW
jgi:hypothetical protein